MTRPNVSERLRGHWRRLASCLRMDRAVAFNLLSHAWSVLAVPLTAVVIAHALTAFEQGFYYTFNSILGLQVFVELGLATVISQISSHEWAHLSRGTEGQIEGDLRALSRLASLAHFSLKWYAIAGVVLIFGVGIGGFVFFAGQGGDTTWMGPWILLCVVVGLSLITTPLVAMLDGCNQIAATYQFRFYQGILSSGAVILCILGHLGLYALAAGAAVRLFCSLIFLGRRYGTFFRQVLLAQITERISWRSEIWGFQWRIAVSWLSGYFISSSVVPFVFRYHGAVAAGQLGMTLTISAGIERIAFAWINTRLPLFGMLVAKQEYRELNALFASLLRTSILVALASALGVLATFWLLVALDVPLAERLLPLWPLALLLGQRVLSVPVSGMAFFLRAHKKEPMMLQSVIAAALIGGSTWILAATAGMNEIVASYFFITLFWSLPMAYWTFRQCRRQWHSGEVRLPTDEVANV